MAINFSGLKNIAVLCRASLGDLICVDVLLQYLRQQAPKAKITLFATDYNYLIADFMSHHDELVLLPSKGNKYRILIKAALKYRKRNFDLVMTEKPSPAKHVNYFLWLLGKKYRVAYIRKPIQRFFVNQGVLYDLAIRRQIHQTAQTLRLLVPDLLEVPTELYPKLCVPDNFLSLCSKAVMDEFNALPKPVVLVSVTNNRPSCILGIERHAAILNQLNQRYDFSVVISYMGADLTYAKALQAKLNMPSIMPETKNFNDVIFLVKNIDLSFLGDGGLVHMSAGFNRQQLALFGFTHGYKSMTRWRPLNANTVCFHDENHVKNIQDEAMLKVLSEKLEIIRQCDAA